MEIEGLILIGIGWLICGIGLWTFYVADSPNPNPIQVISIVFLWPGVLLIFGLIEFLFRIYHLGIRMGKESKSVDYKIAFSNAFKGVFKDRFIWGVALGLIVERIYIDLGLDFWAFMFIWLVIFLVINFLPADKTAR